KVTGAKQPPEKVLKSHASSKNRDYDALYARIIGSEKSIIDLGAGVGGLTCEKIDKRYVAVEAARVLVDMMNRHFKNTGCDAAAYWEDLFELDAVLEIVDREKSPRTIWLFNVIDALEFFERHSSKKLLTELAERGKVVVGFMTASFSGRTPFRAKRFWLINFIERNFNVLDDFELNGERFIVFKKR
ncbi:hypothetical protein H0O02_00750, partial [Candidatus Micrarchaeota archaeon]|nr:hypothetical protein [Candidatus Micrarchaeota archaeon]